VNNGWEISIRSSLLTQKEGTDSRKRRRSSQALALRTLKEQEVDHVKVRINTAGGGGEQGSLEKSRRQTAPVSQS